MIVELTMDNFVDEVKNSDKPVVIDFFADWCGPCKMMAPIFQELAQENTNIKFAKCNVDDNTALAMQFQVQSIPTIVVVKDGNVAGKNIGFVSKDELENMIHNAIA